MIKQHIEVITLVERRRRWLQEDKEWLVAASLEPGAGSRERACRRLPARRVATGASYFNGASSCARSPTVPRRIVQRPRLRLLRSLSR